MNRESKLSKSTRGVKHYLNLKKDFESDKERLAISLPLFLRIMYLDQPNPWLNEINRFDFIHLFVTNSSFGTLSSHVSNKISYCTSISTSKSPSKVLEESEFLNTIILEIDNEKYNLQEFVLGVAYTGGLHMQPEKAKDKILHDQFVEPFDEIAIDILYQISKIFLDVYDELYSFFLGDSNSYKSNFNFAPIIFQNEKVLDGSLFDKAYMQIPLRKKRGKGIRICLEIKFDNSETKKDSPILYLGHRKNTQLLVRLFRNGDSVMFSVQTEKANAVIKYQLNEVDIDSYLQLEFALYPNGVMLIAVNGIVKDLIKLEDSISIIEGKLILGSDLSGSSFGKFYEKTLVIQTIDRLNSMRYIGVYSLQQLKHKRQNIDHRIIKREFI